MRLLVAMIVIVILAGFVLGIVAKLLGFDFCWAPADDRAVGRSPTTGSSSRCAT